MQNPIFCQIRVKGHLSGQWTSWLEGLEIQNLPEGSTRLSGDLPDQTALYGVLNRLRDLGLALISVNCIDLEPNRDPDPKGFRN